MSLEAAQDGGYGPYEYAMSRAAALEAPLPIHTAFRRWRHRIAASEPACWGWSLTQVPVGLTRSAQLAALEAFQQWRCAVCGGVEFVDHRAQHVIDHEHVPGGLVRGLLCQMCNLGEVRREGKGGLFEMYRSTPATAVIGLRLRWSHNLRKHREVRRVMSLGPAETLAIAKGRRPPLSPGHPATGCRELTSEPVDGGA